MIVKKNSWISVERDPNKRRVKPVETAHASLLDFDLGESSDDSDFRIEDHCDDSDDDSVDSNDAGNGNWCFFKLLFSFIQFILFTPKFY